MSYSIVRAVDFLDRWLPYQIERSGTIGLAAAISYKGNAVFSRAYGLADVSSHNPLTADHVFNIGSLGKMMTATMVMQLVEAGKLSLRDRAVQYLPWLARHRDARAAQITVGQLLSHRAGLSRDGVRAGYWQLEEPFPDSSMLQKLVLGSDIILDGYNKFKYSNLGYALLGQIIERACAMPYAEAASQLIIAPLDLGNTFASYAPAMETQIATGYTRRLQSKHHAIPRVIPTNDFSSVAGWYANAADVCRFMAAHFSDADTLLGAETKQAMHQSSYSHWVTPSKRGTVYGSGFMKFTVDGHELYGHGGGFMGHTSYAFYDPPKDVCVVLLTNTKDAPFLDMARGVYNILDYFFAHATAPTPTKYARFNTRVMNLWATVEIVATNRSIASVDMCDWLPFKKAETLTYEDPTTLRVAKASDIAAEGEPVTFHYKNDQLQYVNYTGQILRPEAYFNEWIAKDLSGRQAPLH